MGPKQWASFPQGQYFCVSRGIIQFNFSVSYTSDDDPVSDNDCANRTFSPVKRLLGFFEGLSHEFFFVHNYINGSADRQLSSVDRSQSFHQPLDLLARVRLRDADQHPVLDSVGDIQPARNAPL